MRLVMLLIFLLAVPAFGFSIGTAVQNDIDGRLAAKSLPPMGVLCALRAVRADPKTKDACQRHQNVERLRTGSMVLALIGLALPLIAWLVSRWAGRDRDALARVFPPLVRFLLIFLVPFMLVQGIVFTYAAYLAQAHYMGKVYLYLTGLIAFGALAVTYTLAGHAFRLGRKEETYVAGKMLPAADYPKIHEVVALLAGRLGARKPDHIVAGLDPTFFVTSADVKTLLDEEPLKGETLFVSLPICRLFNLQEFAAVIGHELGHFRGQDTAYSLKFAPVYAGLGGAIHAIDHGESGQGSGGIFAYPALAILGFLYEVFTRNERAISRERELAADQAAMEVSTPGALGTALVKVAIFSSLWNHIKEENLDRLGRGLATRNMSRAFANSVRYDIDYGKLSKGIDELLETEISHPTDSHPTIAERLTAAAGTIPDFDTADLKIPEENAVQIFNNPGDLEEELTAGEHNLMLAVGAARLPDDDDITDEQKFHRTVLNGVYILVSSMITADGVIDDREIDVAEGICRQAFADFEPIDFRECCRHLDERPSADEAAEMLAEAMTADGRTMITDLLSDVAAADDDVSPEEQALLARIKAVFDAVPAVPPSQD